MLIGGARIGTAQIGMVMWKKSNIGQPAKYNFLLRKPIGYKFKFSFSSYSPAGECEHREVEIVAKGQRRIELLVLDHELEEPRKETIIDQISKSLYNLGTGNEVLNVFFFGV